MAKKLSWVVSFCFVICFFTTLIPAFAAQKTGDIWKDGAYITQADVDKIYAYEKLMRAYMAEEKTDKISDERFDEIVREAGFATKDHFNYMLFRITTLRGYINFKYNPQMAEDMESFLAMVYDGEVRLKDDALPEMAQRSLEMITPPEPTEAEIKLILANWEELPRAIHLAD